MAPKRKGNASFIALAFFFCSSCGAAGGARKGARRVGTGSTVCSEGWFRVHLHVLALHEGFHDTHVDAAEVLDDAEAADLRVGIERRLLQLVLDAEHQILHWLRLHLLEEAVEVEDAEVLAAVNAVAGQHAERGVLEHVLEVGRRHREEVTIDLLLRLVDCLSEHVFRQVKLHLVPA